METSQEKIEAAAEQYNRATCIILPHRARLLISYMKSLKE
jgi:hypothetical protein